MLRIIAGEYRSRRLESPPDETRSRPYSERIKGAVCNRLRGWFEDARVLDLFAGVGTMGLEAVSRGAAEVVLVEQDRVVYERLKRNIEALGCGDRATPVKADALGPAILHRAPAPTTLLFVDPPYALMQDEAGRGRVLRQIELLRPALADESLVILRTPLDPDTTPIEIPGFDGPESYRYGPSMWVCFYGPQSGDDDGAGA